MKITMTIACLALFVSGQALAQSDAGGRLSTLDDDSGGLYIPDTKGAWTDKSVGAPYEYAGEKKTTPRRGTVRPRRAAAPPQSNNETVVTTDTKKEAGNGSALGFAGAPERLVIPIGVGVAVSCILAIYFVLSRRSRRERRRLAVALMNLHDPPTSVYQHKTAATDSRSRKAA